MSETPQNDFNVMSYMKIFFRRKELLLIPAFAGLILGICAGIIMPKKFLSSTVILVEEGKTDNPLFNNLAVSSTVRQRLAGIRESMLGWNSLVELVKRMNLDRDVKSMHDLENLVLGIRKNIIINLRGGNILEMAYVGEDPEKTQQVVKNITEIFIERNVDVQNQETADAIKFIEEQLKVYRGKIKSAEIAKLKDQLTVLLTDSTDMHPRVRQLREEIANKEEELRQENLEYTENINLEEGSNNQIIEQIRQALDSIDGAGGERTVRAAGGAEGDEFYKVMLMERLDNVMARDVGVNNTIYNMLLQRLETAKITQRLQSSKEGTKYTVLDPPRVPLRAAKPNKLMVALAGLGAGLALGFGLVFVGEFMDKSFIDVEDAKQFLGVPLLGAISKIRTVDTVRRKREQQAWLYSLTIVLGVVAVILTKAAANFLK